MNCILEISEYLYFNSANSVPFLQSVDNLIKSWTKITKSVTYSISDAQSFARRSYVAQLKTLHSSRIPSPWILTMYSRTQQNHYRQYLINNYSFLALKCCFLSPRLLSRKPNVPWYVYVSKLIFVKLTLEHLIFINGVHVLKV